MSSRRSFCTFCRKLVAKTEQSSDHALSLIETLCKAANVDDILICPTNNTHVCRTCDNILQEIANNYNQLQIQLRKIKSIILDNFNNVDNQSTDGTLRQNLVKDLNPKLLLDRVSHEEAAYPSRTSFDIQNHNNENDLQETGIQIKEEPVEYEHDHDHFEDFGPILPDNGEELLNDDPDFKPQTPKLPPPVRRHRKPGRRKLPTKPKKPRSRGPPLLKAEDEFLPQPSPIHRRTARKRTTRKLSPIKGPPRLKAEITDANLFLDDADFQPPPSPQNSTTSSTYSPTPPPSPVRRRPNRRKPRITNFLLSRRPYKPRGKYNKLKKAIDFEESDLRLTKAGLNGAYLFGGLTLTPVENDGQITATSTRTQRNNLGLFKCGAENCGRITRGLYNLKAHVRRIHLRLEPYERDYVKIKGELVKLDAKADSKTLILHGISVTKTEDGQYQCGACEISYPRRYKLLCHIRYTHAKIPRKYPKVFGPETEVFANRGKSEKTEDGRIIFCGVEILTTQNFPRKFACGKCGVDRKYKASMYSHIKIHHPESKPYACPDCELSFAYKHLLEQHVVRHQNDKPFICEKCGVTFKRKDALREHDRRVHLKIVNATCHYCGKGFYTRKDLRQHSKVHEK